jgi:hypothetical protein
MASGSFLKIGRKGEMLTAATEKMISWASRANGDYEQGCYEGVIGGSGKEQNLTKRA